MEQVAQLTEKTVLPITLVITIILGAMWISEMHSHVVSMEKLQEDYSQTVKHIDERLSRIEGKLGVNFGSTNEIQTEPPFTLSSEIRRPLCTTTCPLATLPGV